MRYCEIIDLTPFIDLLLRDALVVHESAKEIGAEGVLVQKTVLQIVWSELESARALDYGVVWGVEEEFRIIQVSASELGTSDRDLAFLGVPDKDGCFDSPDIEGCVLAAIYLDLSCVIQQENGAILEVFDSKHDSIYVTWPLDEYFAILIFEHVVGLVEFWLFHGVAQAGRPVGLLLWLLILLWWLLLFLLSGRSDKRRFRCLRLGLLGLSLCFLRLSDLLFRRHVHLLLFILFILRYLLF